MTDRDGAMIVSAMPPATNSYNHRKPSGDKEQGQASGRDNHKGSRGQSGAHGKPNWQDLGGEFLHFTLHKENKDTMECVSWLSKVLKLGPRAFEFAGTKDRRAISVQRVSVYRQTIGRMIDAGLVSLHGKMASFNSRSWLPNAKPKLGARCGRIIISAISWA